MRFIGPVLAVTSALALAAATTAYASVGTIVEVSGPSPYATCTFDAGTGTIYVNAEVEPQVAVNPANSANIVAAWQQDRWSNGGAHGLVAGYSFDGGATWGETPLPFSNCAPGGANYNRASDPWVSIGPDGTVYANAISFNGSSTANAVIAATSPDGGQTWGNVVPVVAYPNASGQNGGQYSTDKNSITANPVKAGYAYSVWDTLIANTDNPDDFPHTSAYTGPAYFSRTTDGGRTWSAPQVIFSTTQQNQTIGNILLVDPRGGGNTLYDFASWIVHPNSAANTQTFAAVVKSTDGGLTWGAPVAIAQMQFVGVRDPNTGAAIRTGDIIPDPAIDPKTGQLYMVWQQAANFKRGNTKTSDDQIVITTSTDGGQTWTQPKVINTYTGLPAFTPVVDVNSKGKVGVTYYDFRNLSPTNTTTLPTDYWFVSLDSQLAVGAEQHVAGSFDMLTAPIARGYFVGDYEGLAASGQQFVSFFVQANSGNTANRTDTFATVISV
jgi:Neuraminidase (sialidase)